MFFRSAATMVAFALCMHALPAQAQLSEEQLRKLTEDSNRAREEAIRAATHANETDVHIRTAFRQCEKYVVSKGAETSACSCVSTLRDLWNSPAVKGQLPQGEDVRVLSSGTFPDAYSKLIDGYVAKGVEPAVVDKARTCTAQLSAASPPVARVPFEISMNFVKPDGLHNFPLIQSLIARVNQHRESPALSPYLIKLKQPHEMTFCGGDGQMMISDHKLTDKENDDCRSWIDKPYKLATSLSLDGTPLFVYVKTGSDREADAFLKQVFNLSAVEPAAAEYAPKKSEPLLLPNIAPELNADKVMIVAQSVRLADGTDFARSFYKEANNRGLGESFGLMTDQSTFDVFTSFCGGGTISDVAIAVEQIDDRHVDQCAGSLRTFRSFPVKYEGTPFYVYVRTSSPKQDMIKKLLETMDIWQAP